MDHSVLSGYVEDHLTAEQLRLRDDVRRFAEERIRPTANERSEEQRWDAELWRELGEHRWPGVVIPEEYGGMGKGPLEHAIIVEEISRVDASLGAAQNLLQQTVMAVLSFGTSEQKERYLPAFANGSAFSITGITEAGAGSKLSDMTTIASRVEDGWVLKGTKSETHIPSESAAALIFAKTESGISAFLVDTGTPGFEVGDKRGIIGLRGLPMYEVHLRDCHVHHDSLLAGEGEAMRVFFKSFDLTRIGNAAKCIGIAEGALADAVAYAEQRRVGSNVVTDFQGIRWQLVDLFAQLAAARLAMYHAARAYEKNGRATNEAAIAKLLASQVAMEASIRAVQVTGSYGCFDAQAFGRYMQDAKVSQVTGGTVEILRNTLANSLFGKAQ